ncbi:MAG: hypothetical protein ACUVTH_07135 [Thermogutta sp.]
MKAETSLRTPKVTLAILSCFAPSSPALSQRGRAEENAVFAIWSRLHRFILLNSYGKTTTFTTKIGVSAVTRKLRSVPAVENNVALSVIEPGIEKPHLPPYKKPPKWFGSRW